MGRPKKKGGAAATIPNEAIKRLWTAIPIKEWLFLLKDSPEDFKWEAVSNTTIKGCCPYHVEKTPSFFLNFSKGFGKCFGTCEKIVMDPISLLARLRNVTYTEILYLLKERYDLGSNFFGVNSDELERYNTLQEMKKQAAIAFNSIMIEIIRDNPAYLHYAVPALAYIVNSRKISTNNIKELPIGIFGKPEHVKKYMEDMYHDLYDEYFKDVNVPKHHGALILHANGSPGTISTFKIRMRNGKAIDAYTAKEGAAVWAKFLKIPEADSSEFIEHAFSFVKDPHTGETGTGLFGLHKYRRQIGNNDANAFITEGEFDALAIMNAQDNDMRSDFMIFATGGRANLDASLLRTLGIRTVWLVQDHPSKNGDSWAKSFLLCKKNFDVDPANPHLRPLDVKIFTWPHTAPGQDLWDMVNEGGYEVALKHLWHEKQSYFMNSAPWIESKCMEEIEHIKEEAKEEEGKVPSDSEQRTVEIANIKDSARKKITDCILTWFRYFTNPEDRSSFIQQHAIEEGIDLKEIGDVYAQAYSLDTIEGVDKRLTEALEGVFNVAYYDKKSNATVLTLWSKLRGELITIAQDSNGLVNLVCTYTKVEFYDWFMALVGTSSVINDPVKDKLELDAYKTRITNAVMLVNRVFGRFFTKAENRIDLGELAQGIFYCDIPVQAKRNNFIYFVNGKKLFRGQYNRTTENLDWVYVNNAVDHGTLFRLAPGKRWSHVDDVSDLHASSGIDKQKLLNDLKTIVDGWKFQNHDVMSWYLAAYILALPIMRAVGPVNITYVTGESESGKTSFVQGLLGGQMDTSGGHEVLSLMESSMFSTDTTEASMYQKFDRCSLMFIKDEAEALSGNSGAGHAARTQSIFAIINSIPHGGAYISRGSADPTQGQAYHLRMPVLLAGINIPADPVFISRVVVLNTMKEVGRKHLDAYIAEHFSEADLEQMRKDITVALLPDIPKIMKTRAELRKRLSKLVDVAVSTRYTENLLTPLAVLEYIKGGAEDLYVEIIKRNKNRLESIHSCDMTNDLITTALYNKMIKMSVESNITDMVNAKHLIMTGNIQHLNNSDSGVYYLPDKFWIIIVWRQAKFGALERTKFAGHEEAYLRERASKNIHVVMDITDQEHKHIQKELGLMDVKSSIGYTVVRSSYLVDAEDKVLSAEGGGAIEEFESTLQYYESGDVFKEEDQKESDIIDLDKLEF